MQKGHSIKTGGKVEIFGTILTNQNGIHEEIKRSMISGNACYHLGENVFSSRFLSKNTRMNMHLLIYSMEQSPSWESNRFSASQEIARILLNPMVHCRVYLSMY